MPGGHTSPARRRHNLPAQPTQLVGRARDLDAVAQLLARLDRLALDWEAHDLPSRHQTLRAAIDCSYELLAPEDQTLLRRLGVFAGGWTLEAAEAVANRGEIAADVLDGLAALVGKSLVRATSGDDENEPRFDMLATIDDHALEQLQASGELERTREWHAGYFLELAERVEPALLGPHTDPP
jgi:predicted ATPase